MLLDAFLAERGRDVASLPGTAFVKWEKQFKAIENDPLVSESDKST